MGTVIAAVIGTIVVINACLIASDLVLFARSGRTHNLV